jgi:hypothetical protein
MNHSTFFLSPIFISSFSCRPILHEAIETLLLSTVGAIRTQSYSCGVPNIPSDLVASNNPRSRAAHYAAEPASVKQTVYRKKTLMIEAINVEQRVDTIDPVLSSVSAK